MKAAVVLVLLVALCFAENDIYMGGNFLLTLQNDDGNLNHVASLVAYNPDEDKYVDTFDGGVFNENGFINLLQETPHGMFGTGIFRYMDDDFDYSNSVVYYNNDDDEFEGVKDGIYLRTGDLISFIAGTNDHTYFAGNFDSVEYLSEQSGETVNVPNIVRINSDEDWELLDNDGGVFPASPKIQGLSAYEDTLYIYASGSLYSYTDSYTQISSQALIGLIETDSFGNVAGIALDNSVGDGDYSFVFFDVENDYQVTSKNLFTVTAGFCTVESPQPQFVAWNGGYLITMPNINDNCTTHSWAYFNSTTKTIDLTYTTIPNVDSDIDLIEIGENNDIWLASHSKDVLGYLPFGGTQWIDADLSFFGVFTVYAMAWDSGEDKLMVYGSTSLYGMVFVEVVPSALPPIVKQKNPGILVTPGIVNALAVMNDPDDDDYELYIGGQFDGIGHGHSYSNFVRYKDGEFDAPLPNMPPIQCLASHNSTVFYSTVACVGNTKALPIGYYTKNTAELDVWRTVPTVVGGSGCVTALFVDDYYVFVGGSFSVMLPETGDAAHAVVYFDRRLNSWKDIGLPATLSSSGDAYDINALSVAQIGGTYYLAIGGHFDVTVGNNNYHSFAVYNLNEDTWYPVPVEFDMDSIVNNVIIDEISSIYIAGTLQLNSGSMEDGVFSYNLNTNTYSGIGNLPTTAQAIILNTDDNDETNVFASGSFQNQTNHLALAYTNVATPTGTAWTRAAESSQFLQYYLGSANVMVYTTGGLGANDTNGYDPDYTPPSSSSGGGMSGWGIFFLVAFILLVVIVAVAAAVGGFMYFKKRQNYQEL